VTERTTVHVAILALGIAAGGLFAGSGIVRAKAADRYVTVKGVAERDAQADLAIWPLRLSVAANDLPAANAEMASSVTKIRAFLTANGIDTAGVVVQDFIVRDQQAQLYGGDRGVGPRYVISQTLLVRSTAPDVVQAASQRVGDLVNAGVPLTSGAEYGGGGPTFVFSGLNALKPEMIAEATARARESAEQFARDSRSSIGGIRQANQGYFEILPRDQAPGVSESSQLTKRVRVVATVEYLLKD
jgi:uncharacterized protein